MGWQKIAIICEEYYWNHNGDKNNPEKVQASVVSSAGNRCQEEDAVQLVFDLWGNTVTKNNKNSRQIQTMEILIEKWFCQRKDVILWEMNLWEVQPKRR